MVVQPDPNGDGAVKHRFRNHVVQQAFAPACDPQQLAVALFVPAPRQPAVVEGLVERHAVAVSLGFGKRTVDIPEQGFEGWHHAAASVQSASSAKRSGMTRLGWQASMGSPIL